MSASDIDGREWSGAAAPPDSGGVPRLALLLFSAGVALDQLDIPGYPGIIVAVRAAGVALLGGGVLAAARSRSWRPAPAALLWLFAYAAWTSVTLLWAHDFDPSWDRARTNAQLAIFLLLAWQVGRRRADLRAAMSGYVGGCVIIAIGAWRSFLAGITHVEMKFGPDAGFEDARFVAVGYDPNDMALILALAIPMAGYLALNGEGRARRLWMAYMPFAMSAIALSGSRGSSLATAIAIGTVLIWIRRRSVPALAGVLALFAAGMIATWLQTPETWERIFSTKQQLAGGTFSERIPIWHAGWQLFLRNPVAGAGVGGFAEGIARDLGYAIVAHNTTLSVAAETGLIGLFLFYAAPASILWNLRGSRREDRGLVMSLLLTWFVGVNALTWETRKATWFVFLVGAMVASLRGDDGEPQAP